MPDRFDQEAKSQWLSWTVKWGVCLASIWHHLQSITLHLSPCALVQTRCTNLQFLSSQEQILRGKTGKLSGSFFHQLEGWRLQCRFSFNLEVRAKSLNVPFVKSWGPRSYRDSSSSRLLWQVNQNTLMLYCFPIFLCLWLAALLNQIPSFSCKKLLLLNFCQ